MALGGAHLPDERAYGVGLLLRNWLDDRRPRRRAPMTADRALNIVIIATIVLTLIVIVVGEVIQRRRRR